jgi:hypothetical protein
MFAVDRGGNPPYLSVRFNEANAFSTWRKIAAGKADGLTTARNIAGVSFDGSADITLTGQNISTSTSTAANDLEVAKYLRWKNYGNNHILIDASQGTSPSGTAIDKVTPSFPINSTTGSNTWGENISLMGWNGSNTYGVRVDRARVIDNQANSATVTATSSNTASQIVLRDGSGNFSAGRIDASSVYDINDTAYFLDPASSTTSLRVAGALKQGSDYAHPNVEWSTQGASTGMVVIKLPGTSANYGMIHAVIDIYEYDSATNVCTIYIGGHNWSGQWYNYGANVIGDTNKAVRVGFKDGQYCIVIGSAASSWSFGQVRLRKIQNGTYYSNNLDVGGTYTISQTATESFTWVSGEMRTLKTPQDFYAGGAVSALRLVSTTTTGTAPLTVASTTLVTNLNADLLDGYHASTSNTANTVVLRDGSGNFNAGTIYANLTSSIDQGIVAQNNGNGSQWYGRILSKNSTSGKAAFLGTYGASAVGVFAHNNALDTWTDLYVNTVDGSTGGTVRMPATVLINGSQVIHAGNYTSYSPSLTGTGASGSWPISISGSASSITGTYSGSISSSQVTTALGYSPAPRYVGTAANVSSAAYTCAFTVSGNALASSIRFTVQGTAGNVVVNSTIDVSVNHYQDIVITSQSGIYTVLTVRVVSNNDEAFAVLLTTNSVNAATLNIEVFPFNSESVTFTTTNPFSGATLTHQCDPGTSTSATGGNSGDLRVAGSIFQAGNQVLHAGNYNSYSPTLTGTGASGTWGISISGNADTATSADKIDGVAFRNTGSNSGTDADSLNSNGITYVNTNISLLGQTDGALYSQAYNSDWQHQIYGDYRTGQIVVRGKRGDLGTWQSWRTVLDSSNYTSYVNNGTLTLNVSGTGLSGSTSFTANQSGNTTFTVTSNATSANTGGTIVARDGSGNFSAGTITANSITGLLYAPRNTVYNNLGNPSADEKALFHGQFNNKLRFIAPYLQEESTNGSTWTASSRATSQQLADLMIGEGTGTSFTAIPAPGTGNAGYYRLTWNVRDNVGYCFLDAVYFYNSTNGNNVEFKVEAKDNASGNWVSVATGTIGNWPGHTYIPHTSLPAGANNATAGYYDFVRVTFSITSAAAYGTGFNLYSCEWWGGYPQGRRNVQWYDSAKNVWWPAKVYGTQFVDSESTGFYLDPGATSNLTGLTVANTITGSVSGNAGTVTNGVYTTGSYSDPSWLTLSKSKVGLSNVENTALSTWAGSSNITTLGTISSGTVPVARVSGLAASATTDTTNASNITSGTLPAARMSPTVAQSLRAATNISGGGTISVDNSYNVKWDARMIVISDGRGSNFATAGYWDINAPAAGVTITGVGGAANATFGNMDRSVLHIADRCW